MADDKRPVLAIDDEYYVTKAISYMMSEAGIRCLVMTDPGQAMTVVAAENPLVVVLDVNMPKMDGFTLCKAIKEKYKETTVIMLSGRGSNADIENGLKCGASDYILKPFSPVDLKNKITAIYEAFYKG